MTLTSTAMPSWRDRGAMPTEEVVIAPDLGRNARNSYQVYLFGQPHARRSTLAEAKATIEDTFGPLQWTKVPGDDMKRYDPTWGHTTMFNDAPYYLLARLDGSKAASARPSAMPDLSSHARTSEDTSIFAGVVLPSAHGHEDNTIQRGGDRRGDGGDRPQGDRRRPVALRAGDRGEARAGSRRPGEAAPLLVTAATRTVHILLYLADNIDGYSKATRDQISAAIAAFERGSQQATPKSEPPLVGYWTIPFGGTDSNSPNRVVLVQAGPNDWAAVHVVFGHDYGPVEAWVIAMKNRKQ